MILILAIQLVIVVTVVVASRRSLEDALPLLCFYLVLMPLEARLVIPGMFDFNTMRLLLLTLLVLFLIKGRSSNPEPVPLKGLMCLHIAFALGSVLYSLSFATSVKQLISQVLEYYLMYYLLVKTISRVETCYRIVHAMILAVGLCCIFALVEAYASWSILRIFPQNLWITYNGGLDPLYVELGRGLRVRSTFPHPILFGDALAMSIPLTLYLISVMENKRQRTILWITLALMIWAVYKTSSRGPWIGTGIGLILLFFVVKKGVRKYLISIALLAFIVVLARPGIWESMSNLYQATNDPNSPTGTSYIYRHVLSETVKQAVQTDSQRALFGYGLGTFREIGLDIDFMGALSRSHTCDDNWALFLYETGYGGMLIMTLLLAKPMFLALRGFFSLPKPENYFSAVLFITLLVFNFLMLSVAAYSWGQQGYMNWILISLAVSLPRVVRQNVRTKTLQSDENGQGMEAEYGLHVA